MEEKQSLADRAFAQFEEQQPCVDEEIVSGAEIDYQSMNERTAQEEML